MTKRRIHRLLPLRTTWVVTTGWLFVDASTVQAQSQPDYEQPPVSYSASTPHDALAALQSRVASGELAFAGSEQQALKTLLDALKVPVESQTLVFSQTSLQR